MARGELLRQLFLSQKQHNSSKFRSVAMQIIAEEQQKKNNQLAYDLLSILDSSEQKKPMTTTISNFQSAVPKDKDQEASLVDIRNPDQSFDDIILSPNNEKIIKRAILEYRKSELLKVHGLKPRSKFLFCGPPGCGKTLCADVISHELGLPLMYVHFDAVVSSYLGETASNLRKIFDYASQGRWIIFFDEFDAIGKARDDASEHGELKRVINSFLQLLDGFVSPSIIIAATNHEGLLDPALWRRFDEVVRFERPSVTDIQKLITKNLKNFPYKRINIKNKASSLKGMSHSSIERVCMNSIKTCVIDNKDYITSAIFDQAINDEKGRDAVIHKSVSRRPMR